MDTLAAFDAAYRRWWRGDALDAAINRFFARDAEFKESDVKRDEEGKFAEQEGGTTAKPNKAALAWLHQASHGNWVDAHRGIVKPALFRALLDNDWADARLGPVHPQLRITEKGREAIRGTAPPPPQAEPQRTPRPKGIIAGLAGPQSPLGFYDVDNLVRKGFYRVGRHKETKAEYFEHDDGTEVVLHPGNKWEVSKGSYHKTGVNDPSTKKDVYGHRSFEKALAEARAQTTKDISLDRAIAEFFGDAEFKEEDVNRQPKGASGGHGGEFASQETGAAVAEPEKKPKDRPTLERDLSYRDILYGDYPAAKPRSKTVPVIARDLMQRGTTALKALGVESGRIEGPNPETDQLLARVIAGEIKEALGKAGHAGDWYTKRMGQAMSLAAEMHPELATDRDARTAYTAALAITSQGEVVPSNVRLTDQAYRHYRETGRFPTDIQSKERIAMNTNFGKLNGLIDAGGPEGMTKFLHRDFTVRELESLGHRVGGELKDTKVKGSAILGPKIGQGFFQNLNGNYNPVTMDLWFMRGWGRLTGTLQGQLDPEEFAKTRSRFETALRRDGETPSEDLAKLKERAEAIESQHERDFVKYRAEFDAGTRKKSEKVLSAQRLVYAIEGVNQAPSSGGQRNWIRSVVDRTREELAKAGTDLTNADLQALWWYPEKDLYAKLGSRESRTINVDYATALEDLARKHGISEAAITRALGTVDRRPRRTATGDDGGGIKGIWQKGDGTTEKEGGGGQSQTADLDEQINRFFAHDWAFDAAVNGFFARDWAKPHWGSDAEFKESEHPRDQEGKFAVTASEAAAPPQGLEDVLFLSGFEQIRERPDGTILYGAARGNSIIIEPPETEGGEWTWQFMPGSSAVETMRGQGQHTLLKALGQYAKEHPFKSFTETEEAKRQEAETERKERLKQGVRRAADEAARKFGYDPGKIVLRTDVRQFELNGTMRESGATSYHEGEKKGIIELNADMRPEQVAGILAHEVMHQKWQPVYDAYLGEVEAVEKTRRDEFFGPEANRIKPWKEEQVTKEYPIYAAITPFTNQRMKALMDADGVTDYSRDWWKAYREGTGTIQHAIHETLAEIAYLDQLADESGGRLKRGVVKPVWRQFYNTVNRLYKQRNKQRASDAAFDAAIDAFFTRAA